MSPYKTILITHNAVYTNDKRKIASKIQEIGGTIFNDNVFQLHYLRTRAEVISSKLEEITKIKTKTPFSIKVIEVHEKTVGVFSNGISIGEKL